MLDLVTLYTTQRKQYVCWSDQSMHVGIYVGRTNIPMYVGRYSTIVRLGNEELSFVEEFRSIGHVMTANCRDDKDKKLFKRQYAVGNMLVRSSHLHLLSQKSNCSSHIVTPFMDVLFGVIHTRTLLENSMSVLVRHSNSNVLLTSLDTPARVWHLR